MRVESVLGSVSECVPCARVSNQIILYTSLNYRNKINSESLHGTRSGNIALSGVDIPKMQLISDNLRELEAF